MLIPLQAWNTVYADFLGPLPSKDLLLVMLESRTRFPEVEVVRSTNAKSTIHCLSRTFATHGLPRTLVSDNGPPFHSKELRTSIHDRTWHHTPQDYAAMASGQCRGRDLYETFEKMSPNRRHRQQRLEAGVTTVLIELSGNAPLHNQDSTCHGPIWSEYTHKTTSSRS